MFNGLRKMVGSALGSAENLDDDDDHGAAENKHQQPIKAQNVMMSGYHKSQPQLLQQAYAEQANVATPCHKQSKKRKFADPVAAFSAKKK